MSTQKKFKVFVYGTLKRDQPLWHVMKDAEFIAEVETQKKFRMWTNGAYPMITADSNGYFIKGELYSVTEQQLQRLDRVEGCPHLYMRDSVSVCEPSSGYVCRAYVYTWTKSLDGLVEISGGWPVRD